MHKSLAVACVVAAFAARDAFATAESAPLAPPDPARGVIGLAVKVIPPAKTASVPVDAVYFARVYDESDRFDANRIIRSTTTRQGSAYLLNVEPGRYVAVGCTFDAQPTDESDEPRTPDSPGEGVVVFPEADILKTEIDVHAGEVVFMGHLEVQCSTKTKSADGAQAHYLPMIAPKGAKQGFLARAFNGHVIYIGSFERIDRGQPAANAFWAEAIVTLFKSDAGWTGRVAGRAVAPPDVGAGSSPAGAPLPTEEFLSRVCIIVNAAKARASGRGAEAKSIAQAACQGALAHWSAHGCRENPDQDLCKQRLASWDAQLKSSGSSLLFAAAQAGQTSICSTMIAMGSDPNAPIATGATPLAVASSHPYPEIVALMSQAAPEAPSLEEARAALKADDAAKAFALYLKAADSGDVEGQYWVGRLYLEGRGVEKDLDLGRAWLDKAAARGSADATKLLSESQSPTP